MGKYIGGKMGRLEVCQWGHDINNELKYTYEKA